MKTYRIALKHYTDDFSIHVGQYGNGTLAVRGFASEGPETFSINLQEYGLVPTDPKQFYAKNYEEHEGLPDALVKAGVATKGTEVTFGPYDTTANLMTLTAEAEPL